MRHIDHIANLLKNYVPDVPDVSYVLKKSAQNLSGFFYSLKPPQPKYANMRHKVLKVHAADNVLVALTDLNRGESVSHEGNNYQLKEQIPLKHKFAIKNFSRGDSIRMYGVLVGQATEQIPVGALLSTENVKHSTGNYTIGVRKTDWQAPEVSRWAAKTFEGYHRADGRVGTANHWLVIPLVFCENRNIRMIRESMLKDLGYGRNKDYALDVRKLMGLHQQGASMEEILATDIQMTAAKARQNRFFPHVDGIKFLTHSGGCGGTREDAQVLCDLLAAYIHHPNVAGATVLSLGCQNAQIKDLENAIARVAPDFNKPLYIFEQQKSKSEPQLIAEAVKHTFVGLSQANRIERKPAALSKLIVGLECGGSDGFSGISANPTLGQVSDLVVSLGGTTILAEFPELCGVEQELSDRCASTALADKFGRLMRAYQASAEAVGSGFDMNPSPGNIRDGLITDAIKSAGAAKKGGTSPVKGVLDYTEQATEMGLNLLCTPGNDVESTTGLAASGANLILFTTGLGTPTGNPVTPVIKVSTNNMLHERMADIIDFNTGDIISGEATIEEKGAELLDYMIEVASGRAIPRAVALGQDDFIPWKRGVSL